MAAPQAVAEMQRRAIEKPEVAFKAFNTYPWQADRIFVQKLVGALYGAEPNGPLLADIALQMRIDRFAEKVKINIDKDAYKQWLAATGTQQPRLFPNQHLAQELSGAAPPEQRRFAILHAEYGYPPYQPPSVSAPVPAPEPEPVIDPSVPSWQRSAPKAELYVPKSAAPANADKDALAYPKKFEEIIKFLETGQTIPGIRQIPDTVISDPSISTRGTMQAPLKPWEKKTGSSTANDIEQRSGLSSRDAEISRPDVAS